MAVSRPSSLSSNSIGRKKRSPKKLEQELEGLMPSYSPDIPQVFNDHSAITRRLKKTLYYGKSANTDRPSMYLTDLTVECFNRFEDGLDRLNIDLASDITREACISPCTLVLGLTYLGRLSKLNPNYLHSVSSSRLFFVSVDWKVFVSADQFRDVLLRIEQKIAMEQALKRGWFTYTDLLVLCPSAPPWEAYNVVLQALSGCLLLYTTSILSIWSATMMMSHAIPLSLEASKACSAALDQISVVDSLLQYALLTLSLTQRLSLSVVQWGTQVNDTKVELYERTPTRHLSCDCSPELLPSTCLCYLTPASLCETTQHPFSLPVISETNNPALDTGLVIADLNQPFGSGSLHFGSRNSDIGSGNHRLVPVPMADNESALRTDLPVKSASSMWKFRKWDNETIGFQEGVRPILVKG